MYLLLLVGWLMAATSPSLIALAPPDTTRPAAVLEEATFLDAFFVEQMKALPVPGVAFVLVRDGEVVVQRGYGYADMTQGTPVDPGKTLFQVASITKLFTATAVMQLAEQGAVDLHTDVNRYLDRVQVEEAFGTPVTLAHLLTHTAGFDERNLGYAARDAASVRPLGDYLVDRLPLRTLPPGTVTSYSNHGFGLAGLIVENVSGEPFVEYVEQHVLQLLGMAHSTLQLPLPDTLAGDLAQGYRWTGDDYTPVPLLFRNVPPAGVLSATASDMARFMIAHLQEGAYGEARILEAATAREMHRQQFTHHPRLPGMAYGFMEQIMNGHRVLHHGGDNPGYGSLLFLLPDQNTGFFMVSNVLSNTLRRRFVEEFMDRFYPPAEAVSPLHPAPGARTRLARFPGAYRLNRYAHRSLEKLPATFMNEFSVWTDSAGYLVTQDGSRWVEVEPLLFRQAEGEGRLAFREDAQGRVTHLFRGINFGGTLPAAYEKLAWYETRRFTNEFYLSWLLFLLVTWVIWPFAAILGWGWRRWKKRPRPPRTVGMYVARGLAVLFGVATVGLALGFIQPFVHAAQQGGGEWLFGIPASKQVLLWIPIIQVVLMVGLVGFAVQAWRKGYWSLAGRVHYAVLTLAAMAWVVFLVQYNLIGFSY